MGGLVIIYFKFKLCFLILKVWFFKLYYLFYINGCVYECVLCLKCFVVFKDDIKIVFLLLFKIGLKKRIILYL